MKNRQQNFNRTERELKKRVKKFDNMVNAGENPLQIGSAVLEFRTYIRELIILLIVTNELL